MGPPDRLPILPDVQAIREAGAAARHREGARLVAWESLKSRHNYSAYASVERDQEVDL